MMGRARIARTGVVVMQTTMGKGVVMLLIGERRELLARLGLRRARVGLRRARVRWRRAQVGLRRARVGLRLV